MTESKGSSPLPLSPLESDNLSSSPKSTPSLSLSTPSLFPRTKKKRPKAPPSSNKGPHSPSKLGSDIVKLNLGGYKFTTTKTTLGIFPLPFVLSSHSQVRSEIISSPVW